MLESNLSYAFNDKNLLALAITRKAAIGEGLAPAVKHSLSFTKLKFLGSRVLNLLFSHVLFASDLFDSEGDLTKALSQILSHDGLIFKTIEHIGLAEVLILGRGEKLNAIHKNNNVLLAHMQALFGAIWIDCQADHAIALGVLTNILALDAITRTAIKPISVPSNVMNGSQLKHLQLRFGHTFNDPTLLLNALTRQSALEEKIVSAKASFQTLEFLGDKVLGCILAKWLITEFANEQNEKFDERLTPLLDSLICNTQLSVIAKNIRLGDALILGTGEEYMGVRVNQRKLADHVEALIAALWLDVSQDYEKTKSCVLKLFWRELKKLRIENSDSQKCISPKNGDGMFSNSPLSFWITYKSKAIFPENSNFQDQNKFWFAK